MSPFEQETIIRFNETNAPAEVYTASLRVANLLKRRGLEPYKTTSFKNEENGWFFSVPKSAVILKPGKSAIRLGGRPTINAMPSDEQQSGKLRGVS